MKKYWGIIASLFLVLALLAGCTGTTTDSTSQDTSTSTNFRFLLSDDASEITAISEFASVNVTVTKIGFQRGGESGSWIEPEDFEPWTGNLLDLIGTNATAIWNGYIEPGDYTKAFIYVDNVTGTLTPEAGAGEVSDIRIPSDKFHITKPFTITEEGTIVDYVFDITVIKTGQSGQYFIKPQISESGPDQEYHEINDEDEGDSTGELKFRGTILTIDGGIWTVSIGDEVRTVNVTEAEIEGTPAIGLKAKIEGTVGEDNTITASEVEIKEPEEIKELKYEGTIVALGETSWVVEIEGLERTVDVEGAEIEGTPDVGLEVQIEGIVGKNDIILATEIEIEETEETVELEFEGTITAINGNTWTVTIGDQERTVNVENAEIEGEPVIGLEVEIEGTIGESDIILASEIEIENTEEEE